jgi:hypothetical protein
MNTRSFRTLMVLALSGIAPAALPASALAGYALGG